jgi:hypothetical protein
VTHFDFIRHAGKAAIDQEGCPAGAQRRVLERYRGPEKRQYAIASEIFDSAALLLDGGVQQVANPLNQGKSMLLSGACSERREANEICEKYRDLPALSIL